MSISHGDFIGMLGSEFPEAVAAIDQYQKGLLHPEMGAFRRIVEEAIDSGRLWAAESLFQNDF